jgi:hypothetical protein
MTNKLVIAALAATLLAAVPGLAVAQSTAAPAAQAMPAGPVVTVGDLSLTGPFTRATLPSAMAGGGFLAITNNGAEADRLVAAASPVAKMVQLHEMKMEGDQMKMARKEDGIEIPAGETVMLAPGGLHIMFMGLNTQFVEGETVPVTLTFEKAGTVEIDLQVLAMGADSASY